MAIPLINGCAEFRQPWPGGWANVTDHWQTAAVTTAHFATSLVDAG
ncbi:hypothetical protein [Mycobacterium xenopi]|nr:hypothetical protein [Mycobacterium xenopi]